MRVVAALVAIIACLCQQPTKSDALTRTADLISLRVISQPLQGVARVYKSPISKPLFLLWAAPCCTVLRSRWRQSSATILLRQAPTKSVYTAQRYPPSPPPLREASRMTAFTSAPRSNTAAET
jgi:hypothetical protein